MHLSLSTTLTLFLSTNTPPLLTSALVIASNDLQARAPQPTTITMTYRPHTETIAPTTVTLPVETFTLPGRRTWTDSAYAITKAGSTLTATASTEQIVTVTG